MAALAFIALLMLTNSAQAECVCRCINGQLKTICTSPTDTAKCAGACIGNTCLGYCVPYGGLAEQSRKELEAAEKKLPGLR